MSKRFTDSEKWDRPWFRKLPTRYKLLWQFILDRCDIAGVWYVDFELAEFMIGEALGLAEARGLFEKQIVEVDAARWFIRDFPRFQYGELTPNNNLHRSVISILTRLNLLQISGAGEGLISPSVGAKDKDKDKVLDREKDSLGEGVGEGLKKPPKATRPTLEEVRAYCLERKNRVDPERWFAHYEANGWRVGRNSMKDWRAAVRTWESNDFNQGGKSNGQPRKVAGDAAPVPGKYADAEALSKA